MEQPNDMSCILETLASTSIWLLADVQSDLVKVYVGPDGPAREVSRLKHIGRKAHDWCHGHRAHPSGL